MGENGFPRGVACKLFGSGLEVLERAGEVEFVEHCSQWFGWVEGEWAVEAGRVGVRAGRVGIVFAPGRPVRLRMTVGMNSMDDCCNLSS